MKNDSLEGRTQSLAASLWCALECKRTGHPLPRTHTHKHNTHTHALTFLGHCARQSLRFLCRPTQHGGTERSSRRSCPPGRARTYACVCVRASVLHNALVSVSVCVYVCARACAFAMPSPVWSRAAASLHAAATCLKSAKKRRQIQIVRSACTPRRTLAKSETRQAQGSALPHLSLMRHGRRASCCSPSLPLPETPVSFTTVSAVSATTW